MGYIMLIYATCDLKCIHDILKKNFCNIEGVMIQKNKSVLAKKLLYKSTHRGCRETDIILGQYAQKYINDMSYEELEIFETILNISDSDIYDWYSKKKSVPEKYDSHIMRQLMQYGRIP